MVMVFLPEGELLMGSSEDELDAAVAHCEQDRGEGRCQREWFHDEFPDHRVGVNAFWIDRTEVTNAQFAAFLNSEGNQIEGDVTWLDIEDDSSLIEYYGEGYRPRPGFEEYPVIEVSWFGARAYCKWAGGLLPSEERWEYAARGPERLEFPWGMDPPTCQQANVSGCQDNVAPVNNHQSGASWGGVQDLAGNVFEWVTNWSMPYPGSQYDNVDFGTIYKIVRGGSWNFEPYYSRGAHRSYALMPDIRNEFVGFRCTVAAED
jgi:formylglycine-generating enzyme required for sulfatase activity